MRIPLNKLRGGGRVVSGAGFHFLRPAHAFRGVCVGSVMCGYERCYERNDACRCAAEAVYLATLGQRLAAVGHGAHRVAMSGAAAALSRGRGLGAVGGEGCGCAF